MDIIDFNNKTFSLIGNSENGEVTDETIFKFSQRDQLVTAYYYGGSIRLGKIIARLHGKKLHMLYQCMTTDNELKAGKAVADIRFTQQHKIKLELNWEWLEGQKDSGTSVYLEN